MKMAKYKQTVFIVDDDEPVRDALRLLMKSVGHEAETFASGDEFLTSCGQEISGCLILDIRMPGMSGLELQEQLHKKGVNIPIIFITGHGDVPMAVQAMKHGAMDFLQKPFREQDLVDRVNEALEKDVNTNKLALQRTEIEQRVANLTPRERQIMNMIVQGKASKVIAIDLGLSQRTVETHRTRIMHKMQSRSLAELVRMVVLIQGEQP
jgi:FixJ family two-component response regulator